MRVELSYHEDPDGSITQIGWLVRDHEGDLIALGCQLRGCGPFGSPADALELAHDAALRDVERNGGVQVPLPF